MMKKTLKALVLTYLLFDLLIGGANGGFFPLLTPQAYAQNSSTQQLANSPSFGQGEYYAAAYAYNTSVYSGGSTAGGAYSIVLFKPFVVLPGGRNVTLFSSATTLPPITIGQGSSKETVTPTSSSGCNSFNQGAGSATCTVTATFTNAHGPSDQIVSGSAGLQEAINDAQSHGGGVVTVDAVWAANGGTDAIIAALIPYQNVTIRDIRKVTQYWNVTPSTTAFLAVPTTLTAVTALPSATPAGAYGTGTYHLCVAYVDIMGNEGACSLDFSEAGLATGSFIFTAPAASTGAVGYTIYISLTGGTYALSYKVPLTSTICTLTTIETTVAACAVTNATYGQTGATATVTAITVATAPLAAQLGAASTTSDYVANSNGRTTYAYAPGSRVGTPGVVGASMPFTVTTAAATTVPAVMGTVTLPAGFMNYVGRTIRICGFAKEASAGSTSTITTVQFFWDAPGSNTTGVGVNLGGPTVTATLVTANADQWTFCQDLKTTVSGATATAGSIVLGTGWLTESYGAATTVAAAAGPTIGAAAVGSLNLAGEARINVIYLHTTGTDGAGVILQDLTVEVLN
jgi:hypothetical protein